MEQGVEGKASLVHVPPNPDQAKINNTITKTITEITSKIRSKGLTLEKSALQALYGAKSVDKPNIYFITTNVLPHSVCLSYNC